MTSHWKAECVLSIPAVLGEGPCWLDDQRVLVWVDIESSQVCRFDPATGLNRSWTMPSHTGSAVPTLRGDLLVSTQQGFFRLDPDTGAQTFIVDPERDLPGNRFNDGKCDPQGRFWAGTISYDRTPGAASLYRLDAQLRVTRMLDNVTTSNGMAWSNDGRTMYYIDTPTRRVDAFDFDPQQGTIANRRTVIAVPESLGKPDGMTIDRDGMLWVALWGGYCVSRWDPLRGELIGKVEVAAERTSSCCFGGPELRHLYITTARTGLDAQAIARQPLAGCLFCAEVDAQGRPCSRFAG